jgi:hypothetical protein
MHYLILIPAWRFEEVSSPEYDLFPWDEIEKGGGKVREFLQNTFGRSWVSSAKIQKLDGANEGTAFKLVDVNDNNFVMLKLNKRNRASISINNEEPYEYKVRDKDGVLVVYNDEIESLSLTYPEVDSMLAQFIKGEHTKEPLEKILNLSKQELAVYRHMGVTVDINRISLSTIVPEADLVTKADLELAYTCKRYEKKDKEFGRKAYIFHVKIKASYSIVNRIESVTYGLPAWPKPIRKVTERKTRFELAELAWGPSTLYADVKIEKQDNIISLSHPIVLTEEGPVI